MNDTNDQGPDRLPETRDDSAHGIPKSKRDVERARDVAKDVIDDPDVPPEVPAGESERFDVVVLGAGSTGTNVAWYARDHDLTVAVVEPELVGGECSYWACTPSKALLGPVHAVAAARRLDGAAAAVTGEIDPAAVFARRDEFVHELDDAGQAEWLDSIGAQLVRGWGRIVGERRVEVSSDDGTRMLTADRAVVIATGSSAARPPIDGLDEVAVWDNRDATTATTVPARLAILGGGVVGCELAQAFSRLGSEVTVIERGDHILSNYGTDVSEPMAEVLRDDGITVRTGTEATAIARPAADGPVTVTLDGADSIEADELLVATGRRATTADIGLESIGLDTDGPIEVDDHLRACGVEGDWLHAAGDVNGRALLTHQGKYQARCIGDSIAGRETEAIADQRAVPQVVFTDPEIAAVGLGEADAGDGHRVVSVAIDSVAAASLSGQTRGRAALVIDEDREVVVGASFVGPGVGELLHSATIAILGEVPLGTLWHAVPSFPTVSEVWLRLLEADRGLP